MAASDVSAKPSVREFLFELQRSLAREHDVVMDGRDIGTVVLPEADLKIFLTASPQERARRRHQELREKGIETDYEELLQEVKQRDYNDSHRPIAPLSKAEDAVLVDSTNTNLEETTAILRTMVKERLQL